MQDKSNEQLQEEINRRDLKEQIFKDGDSRWASKLTEFIVYALCGLILTGAIAAMLGTIYTNNHLK